MEDTTAYYQMDLGGFRTWFYCHCYLGRWHLLTNDYIHKWFVVQPLVPPKFLQTSTASVPTVAEFPKLRTLELGNHPLWLLIQPMQCGLKFRAAMQNISFSIWHTFYILHSSHCPFPKPAILGEEVLLSRLRVSPDAVDGRNPAPLHTENLPLFTGSCVSQVVRRISEPSTVSFPFHHFECPQYISHTIHVWYIYIYIWLILMVNVNIPIPWMRHIIPIPPWNSPFNRWVSSCVLALRAPSLRWWWSGEGVGIVSINRIQLFICNVFGIIAEVLSIVRRGLQ